MLKRTFLIRIHTRDREKVYEREDTLCVWNTYLPDPTTSIVVCAIDDPRALHSQSERGKEEFDFFSWSGLGSMNPFLILLTGGETETWLFNITGETSLCFHPTHPKHHSAPLQRRKRFCLCCLCLSFVSSFLTENLNQPDVVPVQDSKVLQPPYCCLRSTPVYQVLHKNAGFMRIFKCERSS